MCGIESLTLWVCLMQTIRFEALAGGVSALELRHSTPISQSPGQYCFVRVRFGVIACTFSQTVNAIGPSAVPVGVASVLAFCLRHRHAQFFNQGSQRSNNLFVLSRAYKLVL